MSQRGGPIFAHGQMVSCRLCTSLIQPGDPILCLPWAPFPAWEPMSNFEAMSCHPSCWRGWHHRNRFVELFNRYAEDAILHHDGSIDYLGSAGEVAEHQDRLWVASR